MRRLVQQTNMCVSGKYAAVIHAAAGLNGETERKTLLGGERSSASHVLLRDDLRRGLGLKAALTFTKPKAGHSKAIHPLGDPLKCQEPQ